MKPDESARRAAPLLAVIAHVEALQGSVSVVESQLHQLRRGLAEAWSVLVEQAAVTAGVEACEVCRRPRTVHVCRSCAPDAITPGPGCINCRQTGWDQTPCLPPSTGRSS